eukprot:310055-Amphidinium_carterae.1
MSEISQISKSVIRCAIRVSTMRNQRKVRSENQSQKDNQWRKESMIQFNIICCFVEVTLCSLCEANVWGYSPPRVQRGVGV